MLLKDRSFLLKVRNRGFCPGLHAFRVGCEDEMTSHRLPFLFAFEFGQPFSHLFGSEALKVVFSAGGEGLQGSAARVLAKHRRFFAARSSCVNGGRFCRGCPAWSLLREAWLN